MRTKKMKKLIKNIVALTLALVMVIGNFNIVFAANGKDSKKNNTVTITQDKSIINEKNDTTTFNTSDELVISARQSTIAGDYNSRYIDVDVFPRTDDSDFQNVVAYAKIAEPRTVHIEDNGVYYLNNINYGTYFRIPLYTIETDKDTTVPIQITIKYDVKNKTSIKETNTNADKTTIITTPDSTDMNTDLTKTKSKDISTGYETREATTTIYVLHKAEKLPSNSAIEVTKVDIHPNGYVVPGSNFSLVFQVKNTGDAAAKNIKLTLDGMDAKGINIAQGLSTKDITVLKPGEETTVIYDMKIPSSARGGMYPLKLDYTFNGKNSKNQDTTSPITGSYAFSVDVKQADRDPSAIIFDKINFPVGRLGKNQNVPVSFTLKNVGTKDAQNIKIAAISQDVEGLTPTSSSTAVVKKLSPGQTAEYTFNFKTTNSVATKSYPVEISVEYIDDAVSEAPHKITQIVGVNGVDWQAEAQKNKDLPTSTPILIIEKYSFEPELIFAGTQFKMALSIRNTSDKTIKNIKIALSSDAAKSADATKQTTAASVFTPVQSSNTFYIDSIAAKEKVDKEITMTTGHDTAANTYTLTADVTYEDAQAKQYTSKEIIGITVVQDSKFSIGEINLDPEYFVGTPGSISVDFYNTGKVTLSNFMVEFESKDDISVDTPTYYKGNFPSGSTDNFSANITPNSPDAKKGKLVFTYEDTTGETHTMEKEFEIKVTEMPMTPEDGMENMPPMDNGSGLMGKLPFIGGAALLAAIVGGLIYKKRKKKKEEEDLNLDED